MSDLSGHQTLILMRHGDASFNAPSDEERPLTDRGTGEVLSVIEQCRHELAGADAVYCSAFLRARQTAHLVTTESGKSPAVVNDLIVPSGEISEVSDWLLNCSERTVVVVTHQPFVGRFFDWFGGYPEGRYVFGTANLAIVTYPIVAAGCADLDRFVQPQY